MMRLCRHFLNMFAIEPVTLLMAHLTVNQSSDQTQAVRDRRRVNLTFTLKLRSGKCSAKVLILSLHLNWFGIEYGT
jgi:hypothetical protein